MDYGEALGSFLGAQMMHPTYRQQEEMTRRRHQEAVNSIISQLWGAGGGMGGLSANTTFGVDEELNGEPGSVPLSDFSGEKKRLNKVEIEARVLQFV